MYYLLFFFFNDTATTEIYTLSLHDALPIWVNLRGRDLLTGLPRSVEVGADQIREAIEPSVVQIVDTIRDTIEETPPRSEEHTSELQSRQYLVCRLLLEKKKKDIIKSTSQSI